MLHLHERAYNFAIAHNERQSIEFLEHVLQPEAKIGEVLMFSEKRMDSCAFV